MHSSSVGGIGAYLIQVHSLFSFTLHSTKIGAWKKDAAACNSACVPNVASFDI